MIDPQALARRIVLQGMVLRILINAISEGVAEAVEAELTGEPLREVGQAVRRAEKEPR